MVVDAVDVRCLHPETLDLVVLGDIFAILLGIFTVFKQRSRCLGVDVFVEATLLSTPRA